jgi:hypothetical protein
MPLPIRDRASRSRGLRSETLSDRGEIEHVNRHHVQGAPLRGVSGAATPGPASTMVSEMTSIHRTSRTPGTPTALNDKEGVVGSSPTEGLQGCRGPSEVDPALI